MVVGACFQFDRHLGTSVLVLANTNLGEATYGRKILERSFCWPRTGVTWLAGSFTSGKNFACSKSIRNHCAIANVVVRIYRGTRCPTHGRGSRRPGQTKPNTFLYQGWFVSNFNQKVSKLALLGRNLFKVGNQFRYRAEGRNAML